MILKDEVYFLEAEYIKNANRLFKLPDDAIKAVIDAAAIVKNSSELLNHIVEDNNTIFNFQDRESEKDNNSNGVELLMRDLSGMFSILVLLSNLDELIKFYIIMSISEEILIDT